VSIPAEQMPSVADEPRRAEILVAVEGKPDSGEAIRTGQLIGQHLGATYPGRRAVVLLLSDSANDPALSGGASAGAPDVPVLAWSHPGQTSLEATLRAAESFDAAACALVAPAAEGSDAEPGAARQLLAPVLDDGFDFVSPCYAMHRFDSVVNTAIVYPVMRAAFGRRVRQPLGTELALSRPLVTHLLGEGWVSDPAHAGDRLWLVTSVLAREFRLCQVHLPTPPPRLSEPSPDLAASLARVLGLLFHELRLHAAHWQRIKGSRAVKTYGEPSWPARDAARQPQIGPMVSAFQLGFQELGPLWGMVLSPQTLLSLKRLARAPVDSFALDDALWARIVYDFAVGYHLGTMERPLLLRSMVPLYLAWAASFVREVRDVPREDAEARIEQLCHAFEAAKPHLIARWRWPDRFNP
jgi:hypothetical protein